MLLQAAVVGRVGSSSWAMEVSSAAIKCPAVRTLLGDFVADAPEDDGGMIAVAAEFGAPILLVPVIEEQMIIVFGFAAFPAIEGLIHNEHAQAVAEIEQFRGGRIVAGANGVAAHLLQNFDLPLQGAEVDGGAEGAEVVVVADAVQGNAAAVEQKTVVGRELNFADAKGSLVAVNHFAVLLDGSDHQVTVGLFEAPEAGMAEFDLVFGQGGLARGDWDVALRQRGDGAAPEAVGAELEDLILDGDGAFGVGVVLHADAHLDGGGGGLGLGVVT